MRGLVVLSSLLLVLSGCGALVDYRPGDTGTSGSGEDCSDGVDNDGDTYIDCSDADCDSTCDKDGDGHVKDALGGDDCDDKDANTHPGAGELCDQVDNNCNGDVDEDSDGDGADACADCDDADANIHEGAEETCDDGIDSDCDGDDCPASWSNGFENGMGSEWTHTGAQNWTAGTATVYDGAQAAQSGGIAANQQSRIGVTLTFASGGEINFWHAGSTEANYDTLTFFLNGEDVLSMSGEWAWEYASFPVPAGTHTAEWRFKKDGSVDGGNDAVAVDLINAVGGVL